MIGLPILSLTFNGTLIGINNQKSNCQKYKNKSHYYRRKYHAAYPGEYDSCQQNDLDEYHHNVMILF